MPEKNEVSWTAMLMGYTQCERIEEALELFDAMPVKSIVACNAMILGLGQNGEVAKARWVFDQMREKDDGTWSAMIKVYEQNEFELEALNLFAVMQREGVRPNFPSLISALGLCASLASLDHGKQVHGQLVRSQYDLDVYVASVLITISSISYAASCQANSSGQVLLGRISSSALGATLICTQIHDIITK
nr:pentatricopeptide repeat-containing protein [Quercus suber]